MKPVLKKMGVLDFDDLLLQILDEWETGSAGKRWEKAFSYLLVDEFQDVSDIQYRLVQAWSKQGKGLFVIGDPDQSIYGFRGSDAKCFERLLKDLPATRRIRLTENYRSTPEFLNCALSAISQKRRGREGSPPQPRRRGTGTADDGGNALVRRNICRKRDQPVGGRRRYAGFSGLFYRTRRGTAPQLF